MAIKGLEFAASTVGSPFLSCQIESDIGILRPEKKQRDGICKNVSHITKDERKKEEKGRRIDGSSTTMQ